MPEPLAAHHRVACQLRAPSLTLDLDLTLHAPWTVLFGPSGSGKTTLLRAAAGLLPVTATVAFQRFSEAHGWEDLSQRRPEERLVGYAPQSAALFPHLSVRENLLFASRFAEARGSSATAARVNAASELCRLEPLLHRSPRHLSGGERQRVALARALAAPDARLLLLDEPLSAVDRALRLELLPRLRQFAAELALPVLSVTHDLEEAYVLQADVAVLENSRVVRRGPAAATLAAERASLLRSLNVS